MSDYDSDIFELAREGYCCAQILLQLALDMQGEDNPALIRSMQGLCEGGGAPDGECGALTGSRCLLALYAGKGAPEESADHKLPLLFTEFRGWFDKRIAPAAITCEEIAPSAAERLTTCPTLIGDCAEKAFSLLMEHGFDLDTPK